MRLLPLALLAACVSAETHVADPRDPLPANHPVSLYLTPGTPAEARNDLPDAKEASDLPASATKIGTVDVRADTFGGWKSIAERASKEARAIGGDSIVFEAIGETTGLTWTSDTVTATFSVYRANP